MQKSSKDIVSGYATPGATSWLVQEESTVMRQLASLPARLTFGLAGASAVICGAFGAHALRHVLDADHREIWHTAVEYHFWHALALCLVACCGSGRSARTAYVAFALGIVLFSGSLYLLAIGAPRWTGLVTPFGGLAFIVGWIALGLGLTRGSPAVG